MVNYQKLYSKLFNSITDAIELINKLEILKARELLISAQQETEEEYIEEI